MLFTVNIRGVSVTASLVKAGDFRLGQTETGWVTGTLTLSKDAWVDVHVNPVSAASNFVDAINCLGMNADQGEVSPPLVNARLVTIRMPGGSTLELSGPHQ